MQRLTSPGPHLRRWTLQLRRRFKTPSLTAIEGTALITLRGAICERFPPGAERRAWLRWIQCRADEVRLLPFANKSPARVKE